MGSNMEPTESSPRRVLVADDEEDIRHVLAQVIRLYGNAFGGVEVRTAATAIEALGVLESEKIDLVLSDYKMPGMTGAEFLAEVHRRWPAVPTVLMTGYQELVDDDGQPQTVAASAVIQKPWDNTDFQRLLERFLVKQ